MEDARITRARKDVVPNIGPAEILVILVVALLVFGPNKLPEIGRQVGKAARELRRMQASLSDEVRDVLDPPSERGRPPKLPALTEEGDRDPTWRRDEGGDEGGDEALSPGDGGDPSIPAPDAPSGDPAAGEQADDESPPTAPGTHPG